MFFKYPNSSIKKEILVGKLSLFCLVLAVIFTVIFATAAYDIDKNLEGWKSRAQVSAEPTDMHDYMLKVKAAMEERDMTSGYAAVIFPTPENDMSLVYRTVCQHVDQAEVLISMDRSSPEYQTGLDNLRGSIRELQLHALGFWGARNLFSAIMIWVTWICFFVFGAIWLATN